MTLYKPWQPSLAVVLWLWSFGLLPAQPPAERRYDAGPLTADDFRAAAPSRCRAAGDTCNWASQIRTFAFN